LAFNGLPMTRRKLMAMIIEVASLGVWASKQFGAIIGGQYHATSSSTW
jgi:hypothetical protein